jgi:hypothetical protein
MVRKFFIMFFSFVLLASVGYTQSSSIETRSKDTVADQRLTERPGSLQAEKNQQALPSQKGSSQTSGSQEAHKGQKELQELRQKPEEFEVLVLGVQIFLGRFGYGVGPYNGTLNQQTQAALRAYQEYVGLPITGDIDFLTLKHLTDDNKKLDQALPFLPQFRFDEGNWEQSVQVQGTWTLNQTPTRDALQTSKISCYRNLNRCLESNAKLSSGRRTTLNTETRIFEIKTWDESEIVTKPYEREACVQSILRINRSRKIVSLFRALTPGEGPCAKVTPKDVQFHLTDGSQVYWTLKNKKAESIKRILRVSQ